MRNNRIEAPIGPKDLFIKKGQVSPGELGIVPETEQRVLPLGAFSDFVLTEQPRLLTQVRAGQLSADGIARRQRELLSGLDPEVVSRALGNPDMARLAMLDLSFAMSCLTFSGVTPPAKVQQLNVQLAKVTGLPEMMTFEKIVSINSRLPFSQMRTFADGAAGDSERRFYYGHDLMDRKLKDTTDVAAQAIDILQTQSEQGVDEATGLLARGAGNMDEFADFMKAYMHMPRAHFDIFRRYLTEYPDGTRNASGAFIGMPRLTVRLDGLSPKYEEFLDLGMGYFPIQEQPDIRHAREMAREGKYLVAQCEELSGEPQQKLARSLVSVIEPIRDFRLSHLATVQYHVPGALPEGTSALRQQLAQTEEEPIIDDKSSVVKGTAGFLPGPLLRNTLRLDIQALNRLDALLQKGEA